MKMVAVKSMPGGQVISLRFIFSKGITELKSELVRPKFLKDSLHHFRDLLGFELCMAVHKIFGVRLVEELTVHTRSITVFVDGEVDEDEVIREIAQILGKYFTKVQGKHESELETVVVSREESLAYHHPEDSGCPAYSATIPA